MATETLTAAQNFDVATARTAVDVAVRAPSIHNTQPWRFVLRDDALEIRAGYGRQRRVLDPARTAVHDQLRRRAVQRTDGDRADPAPPAAHVILDDRHA